MMRLIRVELNRLRWRRAVVVLLALAVVVPALIGFARVWDTRPSSPEDQARIAEIVERESNRKHVQRTLAECKANPENWGVEPGQDVDALCEEWVLPQPEWYGNPELTLAEEREGSGMAVILVLGLIAMLVGTTFAGHDWASGSMSNQLLFEPRRHRVWLAKAVTVTVTMLVLATVAISAWWLSLYVVATRRDLAIPEGLLRDCLEQGLRGAAVAGAAALVGYALTMLFRSTVATLGVLFAVVLVSGSIMLALGLGDGRWMPTHNVVAVINDGATYYVDTPAQCDSELRPPDLDCTSERDLSLAQGAGYLGVLTLGIGAASVGSHRRRDVP